MRTSRFGRVVACTSISMLLGLAVQSALAEDHEDPSFGTATLDQVAALYGLDRAGAEKRLLAEIQAAETQRRI
jgi:hypothetical protein